MLSLLLLAWLLPAQSAPKLAIDVSSLKVGTPMAVTEIDTGKLRGDVRRLAWSPDGATLYLQTAEGTQPLATLHHYAVGVQDGALTPLEKEPDWAARYWEVKQDRVAPGIPSLEIQVVQGTENIKTGTGQSGVLDRSSSPDRVAGNNPSVDSLMVGNMGNQRAEVVRLILLTETIATWTNERPRPGMRFGWGPRGSGALVYVGEKGQLVFFDQAKHRQAVGRVKDAVLPAWSPDGGRVAYLQKIGRKKYAVTWIPVGW